ncbi:uncharacterized protein H6S33_001037 [Morchella sextelata]|uniref:uncharacterized protein n=1 Tax=Morchella sextelata TaxID=1174677 RepID=UPI001D0426E9|nr:uncharacterized protein H6S33_001037 [Morchella sextelata]KAH0608809.1 hypothetical protein H6S33_001037 [Morchella sextelata]
MSDIPRHTRLDPFSPAGRGNSEVEAPPSYEEVVAEASAAGQQVPASRQQQQEEEAPSRRKPQPPSSPSSSSQVPESHRQYHQHYSPLFETPASPASSRSQHYSSLLPPVTSPGEASPGIPPNYDIVTSSIPDRFGRRRAPEVLPEGEREIDKERAMIQAEKGRKRWGRTKSPPKQEGVPLEEVCDRFGNRKREIKPPSTKDMILNPPSIRKALSNVRISY